MNAFSQAHQIVENPIVVFVELFEHNDVLVTFLFCLCNYFLKINVDRSVSLKKMLLGMLDNAIGTQGHEAVGIAAEISQKFIGMIGTEDFFGLHALRKSRLIHSRHDRQRALLFIINHHQEHIKKQQLANFIKSDYQYVYLGYILYMQAKSKKQVRVRKIENSPYFISEDERIADTERGSVTIAYNYQKPNQQLVAKIFNIQNPQDLQAIVQLVNKMAQSPLHQNLVRYRHCQTLSQNIICIVMDKCNQGSLAQRLANMKLMPQQKIWIFLTQFCKGYRILFDCGIVHFGIKPTNILINEGIYKISDFGVIGRTKPDKLVQKVQKFSINSQLLYLPPETEQGKLVELTSKVDIYSLGCILYQLAYDGYHPFQAHFKKITNLHQYFEVLRKNSLVIKQRNKKGELRSPKLRELISKMLQLKPEKRISWQKMFEEVKINLNNSHHLENHEKSINEKQHEIEGLRNALNQTNRSSVILEMLEIDEQQQSSSVEHFAIQELLDKQQIKYLQQVMFRLKILFLTITHCNTKITTIIRENTRRKRLQSHMIESIKKVAVQGLLYLLKNIDIIAHKISDYSPSVSKDIKTILQTDRQRILEEYKKQIKVFKNIEEDKFIQSLKNYDLRSYQHCLYNLLTVYCDYYKEGKDTLRVVIAILIEIYDTSLKLTQMTQKQKIAWRNPEFEQIQTKMDEICMNRHEPHEFYSYLMSKEMVSQKELITSLKRVGLLFQ